MRVRRRQDGHEEHFDRQWQQAASASRLAAPPRISHRPHGGDYYGLPDPGGR